MTDFMQKLDALRQAHLADIDALMLEVAAAESPQDSSLVEMCAYHLRTGGKRLRALLPLAIAQALGHDPRELIALGAACEMLHNATLVHDDLQDGDRVRRGQPTVWAKFGSARAINLGDAMFYWALLLLARLPADSAMLLGLHQRFLRETLRVIDGQEREFLLKEMPNPGMPDYFEMVSGKTSGLFALPMGAAAHFCAAPPGVVAALEVAAGNLGILFQIQDDLLDLYADKGREFRGTDLAEGKFSVLVAHFMSLAPPDKRAWLKEILSADRNLITTRTVDEVAGAFRAYGALQAALDEIVVIRRIALDRPALTDYPELQALLAGMADVFLAPIDHLFDAPQT